MNIVEGVRSDLYASAWNKEWVQKLNTRNTFAFFDQILFCLSQYTLLFPYFPKNVNISCFLSLTLIVYFGSFLYSTTYLLVTSSPCSIFSTYCLLLNIHNILPSHLLSVGDSALVETVVIVCVFCLGLFVLKALMP